jgi:hypothetical protein
VIKTSPINVCRKANDESLLGELSNFNLFMRVIDSMKKINTNNKRKEVLLMKVVNIKSMIHDLCVENLPHKDARGVGQLPVDSLYGLGMHNIRRYFTQYGYVVRPV